LCGLQGALSSEFAAEERRANSNTGKLVYPQLIAVVRRLVPNISPKDLRMLAGYLLSVDSQSSGRFSLQGGSPPLSESMHGGGVRHQGFHVDAIGAGI
jgi:hypothetical protein